jgi:hypothetical protein
MTFCSIAKRQPRLSTKPRITTKRRENQLNKDNKNKIKAINPALITQTISNSFKHQTQHWSINSV